MKEEPTGRKADVRDRGRQAASPHDTLSSILEAVDSGPNDGIKTFNQPEKNAITYDAGRRVVRLGKTLQLTGKGLAASVCFQAVY